MNPSDKSNLLYFFTFPTDVIIRNLALIIIILSKCLEFYTKLGSLIGTMNLS